MELKQKAEQAIKKYLDGFQIDDTFENIEHTFDMDGTCVHLTGSLRAEFEEWHNSQEVVTAYFSGQYELSTEMDYLTKEFIDYDIK